MNSTTKLSDALEHCISTGSYPYSHRYMCEALAAASLEDFKTDVMRMVKSVDPSCISLFGALSMRSAMEGDIVYDPEGEDDKLAYGRQFYIWWVFDLKRKGL